MYCIDQDDKIELLKQVYEHARLTKAKDLAYKVKKLAKEEDDYEEQRDRLFQAIKELIGNMTFQLDPKSIADGIDEIIKASINISK